RHRPLRALHSFPTRRSSDLRAYYAATIPTKTLSDKLSASGTFALTATAGSSGAFFGWFNSDLPGEGRQCTLGFHFAGQGAGTRLDRKSTRLNSSHLGISYAV